MIAGWTLSLLALGFMLVGLIKGFDITRQQVNLFGAILASGIASAYLFIGLFLLWRREISLRIFFAKPVFYSLINVAIAYAMSENFFR